MSESFILRRPDHELMTVTDRLVEVEAEISRLELFKELYFEDTQRLQQLRKEQCELNLRIPEELWLLKGGE